jgi:outer membrane autotransporter protein
MTQSSALASVPLSGIPLQEFNITAISLNAQYRLLEEKLRLNGTVSNSTGDVKRTLFQVGADYTITNNHALAFEYDYIVNSDYKNDNVASLIYRFNF